MAGDGPLIGEVKSAIKRSKLDDIVILTGAIDNVSYLLNDSYLLLLTSTSEGIPFAALEALAMGVPVISTNIGAVSEVIKDCINGFLVDPEQNTLSRFVSLISTLLADPELYDSLAKRTRASILPEFTLEHMCELVH
jgi:glycosyltransferase EpsD